MNRLQPFELFQRNLIPHLREDKKRYLVAQTYYRIQDPMINEFTTPILVTEYDNLNLARTHKNAISQDKYASILDLDKDAHRQKLVEMVGYNSKYRVYRAALKQGSGIKQLLEHQYLDRIRNYVKSNTDWRLGYDSGLRPHLEVHYGELFVVIKYGSRQVRVKFEEIENK